MTGSWDRLPGSNPVPLMKVKDNRCKWPVEIEDDRFVKAATYFCYEPTTTNGDGKRVRWCETHYRMSVGAGTPSERASDLVLARA